MAEAFNFNARQYFDFSKEQDDFHNDSYFDINVERIPTEQTECPKPHEDISENERQELSDAESDCFFSPMPNGISASTVYLKGQLRRSLSMNNLPTDDPNQETKLSTALDGLNLDHKQSGASSSSLNHKPVKAPSQEHINRLAQPKRFASQDQLDKCGQMTLAQAVIKFEKGTPKRFRSKPSPKLNKVVPLPWGGTKPHSPKLMTNTRIRPVTAISKEEQEKREIEEAKKFKIKAHPVNKKILKGPLKPHIEKKPATAVEPFHLTEVKKKTVAVEEEKVPGFKAQPLPKSLHHPFKVQTSSQPPTKGQAPNFSKRLTRNTMNNKVENGEKDKHVPQPSKPTRTQPMPFSFEQRDKELMKRKEEFINRVLEEERKAREFHARPPPKAILRSRNSSQDVINEAGTLHLQKRNSEDLGSTFKARPATVLMMKPFEPKKDENHVVRVEAFHFNTDHRLEARHKFDEKIKEKEALAEAYKKQQEELLKKLHEEEVAKIRKQAEHKAQPIKKYKKIEIQPANKVTEPISPKFHTDKIRNKENIQQ